MKKLIGFGVALACSMPLMAAPEYAQPFQQASLTPESCGSGGCVFRFAAVPAGKRLIVTYVSARFYSSSTPNWARFSISDGSLGHELPVELHVAGIASSSGPVAYVVEQGKSLDIGVYGTNVQMSSPQVSVTGYFVNAR